MGEPDSLDKLVQFTRRLFYTGQRIEDAADLYFYNSRWYDPVVGRFLGPDTVVPAPGNPQSLNRYAYVNNNPLATPIRRSTLLPLRWAEVVEEVNGCLLDGVFGRP